MLRLFLRYVIGGNTGKRESAWFAFLLWVGWTGWMIWTEFSGGPAMSMAESMWMVVTPFVFTWLGTAHGFEWVSRQTRWGQASVSLPDAVGFASGGAIPPGAFAQTPRDPRPEMHYAGGEVNERGARPWTPDREET